MKCNICGASFSGLKECPTCQPSIKQCPVCMGNGSIKVGEKDPFEVMDRMNKTISTQDAQIKRQADIIRLLRRDGERLFNSIKLGEDDYYRSRTMNMHIDLLQKLDEQEKK